VDAVIPPGSLLKSPVSGRVTKLGYPYADDLSYKSIDITTDDNHRIRFFYVSPMVSMRQRVYVGQVIGEVQDLTTRYENMHNHVHVEVIIDGKHVDPDVYFS
jgi:murein DD-endopeptidase MepM/ murein hydrolase activator NlpD